MVEDKKDKRNSSKEMSLEEAKAYRASLNKKEAIQLSDEEKREKFRIFWAEEKAKYGKPKDIEQVLWLHLQAVSLDSPEKFEDGLTHFGLKKV